MTMIDAEMNRPVYRMRPLPIGRLEGQFLIAEPLIAATREALVSFALAGIRDSGHEGLVYWVGRERGPLRVLLSVVVPNSDHAAGRVMVSEREVGRLGRRVRRGDQSKPRKCSRANISKIRTGAPRKSAGYPTILRPQASCRPPRA